MCFELIECKQIVQIERDGEDRGRGWSRRRGLHQWRCRPHHQVYLNTFKIHFLFRVISVFFIICTFPFSLFVTVKMVQVVTHYLLISSQNWLFLNPIGMIHSVGLACKLVSCQPHIFQYQNHHYHHHHHHHHYHPHQEYERAVIFRLGRVKKGGAVGPGEKYLGKLSQRKILWKLISKNFFLETYLKEFFWKLI